MPDKVALTKEEDVEMKIHIGRKFEQIL